MQREPTLIRPLFLASPGLSIDAVVAPVLIDKLRPQTYVPWRFLPVRGDSAGSI